MNLVLQPKPVSLKPILAALVITAVIYWIATAPTRTQPVNIHLYQNNYNAVDTIYPLH